MNQYYAFRSFWSGWKCCEPGHEIGRQLRLRPVHGQSGDGIEIIGGHDARNRFVVVPANHVLGNTLQLFRYRGRVWSVSNNIAKTDGGVPFSGSSLKGSFKGREIGMKIAENQKSHSHVRKSADEYSGTSTGMHQRITVH